MCCVADEDVDWNWKSGSRGKSRGVISVFSSGLAGELLITENQVSVPMTIM